MLRHSISPVAIEADDAAAQSLGPGFINHPAPGLAYDPATRRILAANAAAVAFYGYGRTRLLSLDMTDLESAAAEVGASDICWHRKADGTTAAVRVQTSGIDLEGRAAILASVTEVSDLERRCRGAEGGERRYRHLFQLTADYYWEMDAQYRLTYLSPEYEALFGLPVSDMLGKRLAETPGLSIDPEMGRKGILAQKAKQPYRDLVFSRRMPDGTQRWFSTNAAPFFDETGAFQGYRGVAADITERIAAETEAQIGRRRLHDALAHLTQPFGVFDGDDRLVAFNQAFTDLHTTPGSNTLVQEGTAFRDLAAWQLDVGFYGAEAEPIALETLLAHYHQGSEHAYRLRDGRWMLVAYRRLPGGSRVGLWTDITALKRAEEERHDLEAQLHHSQRLEALGTLAGGVAHELNNTLVPVLALTKRVAAKLPEASRERANLETVVMASERARELVQEILTFARKQQLRRESVDLARVAEDALKMMRSALPATILVEKSIVSGPRVSGDPGQLHQAIVNLLTNAAQAIGGAHGTITLALREEAHGGRVRLSVADTGCGMDQAVLARIFDPFFTTRDVGHGTGLGLAVVHGIVTSHGGSVDVESAPGEGTRVDVMLPAETA